MDEHYTLLLKQHIGASAVPQVKTGDTVKKGQILATTDGLGATLHASVSGTVTAVNETAIVVHASEKQPDEYVPLPECSDIAAMAKAAGLVGMGGAGFPSHVKLATDLEGKGVLIANGAECEPLLRHNINQIEQNPDQLRRGMLLAMQATHAARGVLAIKSKNEVAIAAFRGVLKPEDGIEIFLLPDLYPMGEERAIIREVLGVLLGTEQLPSAAGAVVMNVETLARLAEAVELRRPVISKHITVLGQLGSGHESMVFTDVPLGTPISKLIEQAGGIAGVHGEIIMGGPFTGLAVNEDAVVTKTSGGVIVTLPFPTEKRPIGLLVCACGANEARLRDIAAKMQGTVVAVKACKQAKEGRGGLLKCENPGNCPGQAEKIMDLRKAGTQVLLVSNCSDCTNTVMCVAPKLKMPIYHATDHVMRTVGHALIRRLPLES